VYKTGLNSWSLDGEFKPDMNYLLISGDVLTTHGLNKPQCYKRMN
jgi:hypothetical protein